MVESFNGPFEPVEPEPETRWGRIRARLRDLLDRGDSPYAVGCAILAFVVVVLVTYMMFFSSNEKRVTLREIDFYCSQPTAQKRFDFSRTETCDQYSRKVEVNRWSK